MNGNVNYYKQTMPSALKICPSLPLFRGSQTDLISSNFWGKKFPKSSGGFLYGKTADAHTYSSARSSGGHLLPCPNLCFSPGRQVLQHWYRSLCLQMAATNFNHGLTGGFLQFRPARRWFPCSGNFITIMPQHTLPYTVFYLSQEKVPLQHSLICLVY